MSSFANLKRGSGNLDKLTKAIEQLSSSSEGGKSDKDNYWKPEVDKAGNGMAVIRFLPAPSIDGDDALPWVRYFDHGFKGPSGKWYIENSLTTIGQKDPVSEYNSSLWNASNDDASWQRKQARDQKRRIAERGGQYSGSADDPGTEDDALGLGEFEGAGRRGHQSGRWTEW